MNNSLEFKKIFKTYILLLCITISDFIINFLVIIKIVAQEQLLRWNYSLPYLYILFFIFSFIIMTLLTIVKKKNLDYVGYVFLILTSIKMGISYFILKPILSSAVIDNSLEKKNFFIIFISFLAIETILTIRILNNKQ